jgi:hypothetical protein
MLTPQVIELIAKIAIELGEQVISNIIKACHPEASQEKEIEYTDQIKSVINKKTGTDN